MSMGMEEYRANYGESYDNGELWDYPIEELDYLLDRNDEMVYVLIDGRIYETGVSIYEL